MAGRKPKTRLNLEKRDGMRFRCRAIVGRFGTKPAFRGRRTRTIMLRSVTDATNGAVLTDHLWFTCGLWSADLGPGDTIEFDARVGDYVKGYRGHASDGSPMGRDWKLQRPTKVTVLTSSKR